MGMILGRAGRLGIGTHASPLTPCLDSLHIAPPLDADRALEPQSNSECALPSQPIWLANFVVPSFLFLRGDEGTRLTIDFSTHKTFVLQQIPTASIVVASFEPEVFHHLGLISFMNAETAESKGKCVFNARTGTFLCVTYRSYKESPFDVSRPVYGCGMVMLVGRSTEHVVRNQNILFS